MRVHLYLIQIHNGRFFVHEHPHGAASWTKDCVMQVAAMENVGVAMVDMCAFGMRVDTGPWQGPARKMTSIMSKLREVLKCVASVWPNAEADKDCIIFMCLLHRFEQSGGRPILGNSAAGYAGDSGNILIAATWAGGNDRPESA